MGNVGDKLRFHPLGAQPLIHRLLHSLLDRIQVLSMSFQIPPHPSGGNRLGIITLCQRFGALLQGTQVQRNPQHSHSHQQVKQSGGKRHPVGVSNQQIQQKDTGQYKRRFPHQRNSPYGMEYPPDGSLYSPPDPPDHIPDNIVFQQRSRFAPRRNGNKEQQCQIQRQHAKEDLRHITGIDTQASGADHNQRKNIQRDAVQPGQVDLIIARPVSCRCHQPEKAK